MYVSVKHQQLYVIKNDSTIRKYPISTSKNGIGSKQDSYKSYITILSFANDEERGEKSNEQTGYELSFQNERCNDGKRAL